MAFAGVLVALLAQDPGPARVAGPVNVRASKTDGQVVFTLANGNRAHTVYRSASPDRFDRREGIRVVGQFADDVGEGPELVFYRID